MQESRYVEGIDQCADCRVVYVRKGVNGTFLPSRESLQRQAAELPTRQCVREGKSSVTGQGEQNAKEYKGNEC